MSLKPPAAAPAKAAGKAAMTRPQAMARLLQGVSDDVLAYDSLLSLLHEQFDAALRHQSARLTELAARMAPLLDAMELRRQQRVALIGGLLGPSAGMRDMVALLRGGSRLALENNWATLEQLVLDCKRSNDRNSTLLTEQYGIMQRVMHGEDQLYAPA